MKNTIKWLIVALAWTGVVQATSVTPESFTTGFNSGYSVANYTDINNNVDWFVFDTDGSKSTSFFFDRSVAAPDLAAGLYLGDTSGFDYEAAGAGAWYSYMNAGSYNSKLSFISSFDDNHEDAYGGPYGDPDFDMLLAAGRYSLALSSLGAAGTYSFTTNAVSVVSSTPVPAAAWLFGTALLAFFGVSRRKTRA